MAGTYAMIISCWAAETVSPMLAAFAYLAKAIGYTNIYVCTDSDGTWGLAHSWAEINGLVYDPLFAEAKNYNKYYGAPYGVYELHPILHVAL